jgi:hypothetical protein
MTDRDRELATLLHRVVKLQVAILLAILALLLLRLVTLTELPSLPQVSPAVALLLLCESPLS